MNIYDYDVNIIAPQLMPPVLRRAAHLAWLKVILKPIQYLWQLIFIDYKEGSSYPAYASYLTYYLGNRVVYKDGQVYEYVYNSGSSGHAPTNNTYWTLINNNFIGANERVKYNAQIIVLEYALNRWFQVDIFSPQIYIQTNNLTSSSFVMANSSALSSNLTKNGQFSTTYLTNTYLAPTATTNFTIYFPSALYAALPPSSSTDKNNLIGQFVNKYRLAGTTFNIVTF